MARLVNKLLVLSLLLSALLIGPTNSYFSSGLVITDNVFSTGDWTCPVVTIHTPADISGISGSLDIIASVTDNDLSHYWLVIEKPDGSKVAGPGTVKSASFENKNIFTWDTLTAPDGQYIIKLEARDKVGNKCPDLSPVSADPKLSDDSVHWISVTVNNPPSTPENLTIYQGHNVATRTLIPCDGITEDTHITIDWDDSTETDLDYYWLGTQFNTYHRKVYPSQSYYLGNLTPGHNPYYYTVIAVDKNGNESLPATSCFINYQLPTLPPVAPSHLSWINPDVTCGGFTNSYSIQADWNDVIPTHDQIEKYEYHITYPVSGGFATWNTFVSHSHYNGVFNMGEGLHTFKVRAYDTLGKVSDWSSSCSITYDKTAPISVITKPYNSNQDNEITYVYLWDGDIIGTASDNLSGIDRVEISIHRVWEDLYWNGTLWVNGTEAGNRVLASGTDIWSYSFNDNPPEGKFKIISHAVDNTGNVESSYEFEFINLGGGVQADVTPLGQGNILLSLDNLLNASYEYELIYLDAQGIEKGIYNQVSQSSIHQNTYQEQIFLGTCSAGSCITDLASNHVILTVYEDGIVIIDSQKLNF